MGEGLVINYRQGGQYKRGLGRGHQVLPLQKGGRDKRSFNHVEGGHKSAGGRMSFLMPGPLLFPQLRVIISIMNHRVCGDIPIS